MTLYSPYMCLALPHFRHPSPLTFTRPSGARRYISISFARLLGGGGAKVKVQYAWRMALCEIRGRP